MNLEVKSANRAFAERVARRLWAAFTLPEVVISAAIASIAIGGIMTGYVVSARRAEWSVYSLTAHAVATQALERARAIRWDPTANPPIDLLVTNNFPKETILMDLPVSGTNATYATNTITITSISVNPPVKLIMVECVWPFVNGRRYTNTIATYRSPGT
jgi:type II secretory pathway pseudopilin PulG